MVETKQIKPYFVVNPASAAGRTRKRFEDALKEIKPVFPGLGYSYTNGPMHAVELTRQALSDGFDTIIACGGDGTNNEVLNGFLNEDGVPRLPYAAMGIYPSGTGGDFRRTIELPKDPQELVQYLKDGTRKTVDAGAMDFVSPKGEHTSRFFLNIMSFGIGGLVDHYVNTAPKLLGGRASFFLGSLRAMLKYKNLPVRLMLDGRLAYDGPARLIAVANGRFFGGGMMVAPNALTDDGLLDVVVFKDMSTLDFIRLSRMIYTGDHLGHPLIEVHQAKTITAVGPKPMMIDMDGEEAGSTPIKARCVSKALTIIEMPADRMHLE